LRKTKDCFDHNVQSLHDDEIAAAADSALVKHLAFLVWRIKHMAFSLDDDCDSIMTELCFTCESLEAVFRASSEVVGQSYLRMGEYVLQLLMMIVHDELERRGPPDHHSNKGNNSNKNKNTDYSLGMEDTSSQSGMERADDDPLKSRSITPPLHDVSLMPGSLEGDVILRKATRIFGHFARVGSATQSLAHYSGFLGTLVRLIGMQPQDSIPWEARLSALWTIANLACNNENMQMMVCTPGLINSLVYIACRPLYPGDSLERTMEILRSRSIAARAVLNLSWAPETKIILAEHAVLLDLLAELTVQRSAPLNQSRTVREIIVTTRRHAAGALRSLAAAPRRTKIRLSEYRNGHIFDILTDAALNDSDAAVRNRAFAAIHNLAIQDTAEKIVNHPALVLALKDVLLSDDGGAIDEEGSPKSHASATLMVLERSIAADSSAYENLRDLLDAVNPSPASDEQESDMEITNAAAV
jgi:hypothetical protein